jgi:hypothetical protein
VVIVVATSLADDAADAIDRALRSALGSEASVTVRRMVSTDDDRSLRALALSSRATLVGVVAADGDERATLHLTSADDPRWSDREIRFDARDAPRERGRTIGFALAAIVPEQDVPAGAAPPQPLAPSGPAAALAAPSPGRVEQAESLPPPGTARAALDAIGLGAAAVGGEGGGGGGALAGRLAVGGSFRVRLVVGARAGEIAPAQAASRAYFAGGGVAWQPWLDRERTVALGARADALALGEELSHLSADDPQPDRRLRVLPAFDLAMEGTWRFAREASFIGALGAEAVAGQTDVYVHFHRVATVVPFRAIGEVGLRVGF